VGAGLLAYQLDFLHQSSDLEATDTIPQLPHHSDQSTAASSTAAEPEQPLDVTAKRHALRVGALLPLPVFVVTG